ncbi:hypothetical protein FM107_10495 [Sphingobacterium sp. JB170]|nr:hypothetical protein FM107_10495 [Sphingobacterium sp. JB170]
MFCEVFGTSGVGGVFSIEGHGATIMVFLTDLFCWTLAVYERPG